MSTSAGPSRLRTTFHEIISIVLLTLTALTLPGALLESLSNLRQGGRSYVAPRDFFWDVVRGKAEQIPWLAKLTEAQISLLYVVLLLGGLLWLYMSAVALAKRHEALIASEGDFTPVKAQSASMSDAEGVMGVGGLAAMGIGTAMLKGAAAGSPLGPIGVAFGLAIGGMIAIAVAGGGADKRQEEANREADRINAQIRSDRVRIARESAAGFRKRELRKLLFAGVASLLIAGINIGVSYVQTHGFLCGPSHHRTFLSYCPRHGSRWR